MRNLHISGIPDDMIADQLDLDINTIEDANSGNRQSVNILNAILDVTIIFTLEYFQGKN